MSNVARAGPVEQAGEWYIEAKLDDGTVLRSGVMESLRCAEIRAGQIQKLRFHGAYLVDRLGWQIQELKKMLRPIIILRVGKEPEVVESFDVDDLHAMQAIVGGYITVVRPDMTAVMGWEERLKINLGPRAEIRLVADDEGLLKELPVNLVASLLARTTIVGDCFLGAIK